MVCCNLHYVFHALYVPPKNEVTDQQEHHVTLVALKRVLFPHPHPAVVMCIGACPRADAVIK